MLIPYTLFLSASGTPANEKWKTGIYIDKNVINNIKYNQCTIQVIYTYQHPRDKHILQPSHAIQVEKRLFPCNCSFSRGMALLAIRRRERTGQQVEDDLRKGPVPRRYRKDSGKDQPCGRTSPTQGCLCRSN